MRLEKTELRDILECNEGYILVLDRVTIQRLGPSLSPHSDQKEVAKTLFFFSMYLVSFRGYYQLFFRSVHNID